MTIREVVAAMLRRWYIPLVLVVCAALATVLLARDGGVYTTRTVVTFMGPDSTSLSPNGTNDSSVIAFAGSVVQAINNGRPPARYSMDEAPYFGAGVREGVLVELANSGNQWVSSFSKSDVEIEVVGRSFDWVESRQKELVATVLSIASAQQAALALSPNSRIVATVVPLTMQIEHVTASRSGQLAAGAAMLAAAMIVGAWGSVAADRRLSRRRAAAVLASLRLSGDTQTGATT
ncbi:hypothetical protein AB4Y63_15555 [Leifsonia sp. YAF41]|uniref:hypothetical protein n=1 Tax=Leifsonia sp. YAF41 TaxID=3233086 RepID=UPI003F953893